MTKIVVTIVCSLGVALATWLVVHNRNTTGERRATTGDEPVKARLVEGLRVASAAGAAGFVGGTLGFGLGGRLMMRVLAATSPDAQGLFTDAEEIVGDVSVGGTVGLTLFLGLFSALAGLLYVLFRSWLPRRSLLAGLIAAAAMGGLLARPTDLLNPDNRDFRILEPTWLAAILCVAVILLGSLAIAALADRWVASWPRPAPTPSGVAGLLPLLVVAIPPVAIAGVLLVLSRTVRWGGDRKTISHRAGLARAKLAASAVAGVAGGTWLAVNAVQIMT